MKNEIIMLIEFTKNIDWVTLLVSPASTSPTISSYQLTDDGFLQKKQDWPNLRNLFLYQVHAKS